MLYETSKRLDLAHTRNLTTLMDLYERNYACLRKLIPDLEGIKDTAVSQAGGSPDLHLRLVERSRFTTTLCLTYFFAVEDGSPIADPGLQVRVYHDAKLVEAMASRYRPGIGSMPPGCIAKLPILDWKWEINLFLDKWLNYCLAQGHRFIRADEEVFCGDNPQVLADI